MQQVRDVSIITVVDIFWSFYFCRFRRVRTQTQERVDNTKVKRRSAAVGFPQEEKKRD
jgi:hypothetical protein